MSRARITQIVSLNLLARDVQEEILFLPRVERGRDPIREHAVRAIAVTEDWAMQRRMWRGLHAHQDSERFDRIANDLSRRTA